MRQPSYRAEIKNRKVPPDRMQINRNGISSNFKSTLAIDRLIYCLVRKWIVVYGFTDEVIYSCMIHQTNQLLLNAMMGKPLICFYIC